ncbi:protein UL38 [macacine betaherpesvirus 9]|uniref:Protein UL38 n=1 Tax=macacine betaherpesvirus 9 TaxID=2560568 RepID=A0A191S3V1_9BETA|nr:protein UL38 [macacine betaherpesvirus 9]ANC96563.1 protein UL38 [macacine betaherpesvirus 9]
MAYACAISIMLKHKEKLIAASNNLESFEREVKEAMNNGISIQHIMCINVRICDMSDIFPERRLKRLVNVGFYPFEGKMVMFGVAEEWVAASGSPSRQIVFLLSSCKHVFAYEEGIMFYLSPSFEDFWTTKLELSCQNAITHGMSKKMSRYECHERFLNYYIRIRHKQINISGKLPTRFQRVSPDHKLADNRTPVEKTYIDVNCSVNESLPNHCKIYKTCHAPGVKILVSRLTQTDRSCISCGTQTSLEYFSCPEKRPNKPQTAPEICGFQNALSNIMEHKTLHFLEEGPNLFTQKQENETGTAVNLTESSNLNTKRINRYVFSIKKKEKICMQFLQLLQNLSFV